MFSFKDFFLKKNSRKAVKTHVSDSQKEKKERKGKNFQFPDRYQDSDFAPLRLTISDRFKKLNFLTKC